MALISFTPQQGTGLIGLDSIPEEVKQDVEQMYQATYFEADGDSLTPRNTPRPGTFRAKEETKQKVMLWFSQAKDYGAQRNQLEDDEGNALIKLVLRRSPTSLKGRDENEIDLTLRTEEDAKKDAAKEESKAAVK